MTHDPEAAWPLTATDPGYYPGPTVAPPPAPSNLIPYAPAPVPAPVANTTPHGVRIAYLAIILGTAIPLTAIAASQMGLIGLAICWFGIVIIASVVFGHNGRSRRG